MDQIKRLRNTIDEIDDQIMELLDKRFAVTKEVGVVKKTLSVEILDSNREETILNKTSKYSHSPQILSIYKHMMNISKSQQKDVW